MNVCVRLSSFPNKTQGFVSSLPFMLVSGLPTSLIRNRQHHFGHFQPFGAQDKLSVVVGYSIR